MIRSSRGSRRYGEDARGKDASRPSRAHALALSWRWSKVRVSDGYGKYRVSIDDDNGVIVEYRRYWPSRFVKTGPPMKQ